jgi:hypothetical protein
MARLQNALTKQLTDEHERIDLQLREKVTVISINLAIVYRKKKLERSKSIEKRRESNSMEFSINWLRCRPHLKEPMTTIILCTSTE